MKKGCKFAASNQLKHTIMKNQNQFKIEQRVLFCIYGNYTIATIYSMKYDDAKKENYCYCISENGHLINGYEHELISL